MHITNYKTCKQNLNRISLDYLVYIHLTLKHRQRTDWAATYVRHTKDFTIKIVYGYYPLGYKSHTNSWRWETSCSPCPTRILQPIQTLYTFWRDNTYENCSWGYSVSASLYLQYHVSSWELLTEGGRGRSGYNFLPSVMPSSSSPFHGKMEISLPPFTTIFLLPIKRPLAGLNQRSPWTQGIGLLRATGPTARIHTNNLYVL